MSVDHEGKLSDLAREHALHPRNYGPPDQWNGHARVTGPCGDTMEFWVEARDGSIEHVSFITDGCGPSLACGSMATTLSEDRPLSDALTLGQADILAALGGLPSTSEHCALLAARTLQAACDDCLRNQNGTSAGSQAQSDEVKGVTEMKIAIPVVNGMLSAHFGHCESFALVDVDTSAKCIVQREDVAAPPHEPGLLPAWLAERGANAIIAGGMGQRAQGLFAEHGIQVLVGAETASPEQLAEEYLAGTLRLGQNVCDH